MSAKKVGKIRRVASLWVLGLLLSSCKVESTTSCYANLQTVDGAKQQWALDCGKNIGSKIKESDLVPSYLRKVPRCPEGGQYHLGEIGTPPSCSRPEHRYP